LPDTETYGKGIRLLHFVTVYLGKHGRVNAFSIYQGASEEGW